MQLLAPVVVENLPAAHPVQLLAPVVENLLAVQSVQTAAVGPALKPVAAEYFPTTQDVQEVGL